MGEAPQVVRREGEMAGGEWYVRGPAPAEQGLPELCAAPASLSRTTPRRGVVGTAPSMIPLATWSPIVGATHPA